MRWNSTRSALDRIGGAMSRAVLQAIDDTHFMQQVDHQGYAGEQQTGIEHVHPYGFTSVPQAPSMIGGLLKGAEAFVSFLNGNRTHGISLVSGDRRFRLFQLQPGEVALHDDQGHQIHLTRNGIAVSAPNGKTVTLQIMQSGSLPNSSGKPMGQTAQAGQANVVNAFLDSNRFLATFGSGSNAVTVKVDQNHSAIRHVQSGNTVWADKSGVWSTVPMQQIDYPYKSTDPS
jgi:phage gp45-like